MSKYQELMDKIEVTPALRRRVLARLQQEACAPVKVTRLHSWRRWGAAAACLALLVLGAVTLLPRFTQETPVSDLVQGSGILDCSSAQELSENVGFSVPEIPSLAETAESCTYTAYEGLAEIGYWSGEDVVFFRKGVGDEDVSGNYEDYAQVETLILGQTEITLKGAEDSCELAIWSEDGYSYSLQWDEGQSLESVKDIVMEVLEIENGS